MLQKNIKSRKSVLFIELELLLKCNDCKRNCQYNATSSSNLLPCWLFKVKSLSVTSTLWQNKLVVEYFSQPLSFMLFASLRLCEPNFAQRRRDAKCIFNILDSWYELRTVINRYIAGVIKAWMLLYDEVPAIKTSIFLYKM